MAATPEVSHILVVTGMSGAGRSTALRVLEDLGFFCVDNLPPSLVAQLMSTLSQTGGFRRVGLGVDVRGQAFLGNADQIFETLRNAGHEVEIIFIDCADEILVRRFSETRRPHPLAPEGQLLEAIQYERERMASLRAQAHHVFDTTRLSVHELRRQLVDFVARGKAHSSMVVRIVSFGFKYGLPVDADIVWDLRYLPNPHFVETLRPQLGTQPEVSKFVLQAPETEELLSLLTTLLERTLPNYEREGKAYLTIALGCTGGRHRSVAVAEELAQRLRSHREILILHRDIQRG